MSPRLASWRITSPISLMTEGWILGGFIKDQQLWAAGQRGQSPAAAAGRRISHRLAAASWS